MHKMSCTNTFSIRSVNKDLLKSPIIVSPMANACAYGTWKQSLFRGKLGTQDKMTQMRACVIKPSSTLQEVTEICKVGGQDATQMQEIYPSEAESTYCLNKTNQKGH